MDFVIYEWEWGYVSLKELEDYKGYFGLGIERDIYSTGKQIKDFVDYPYKGNYEICEDDFEIG